MKKIAIALLLIVAATSAYAYDFSAVCSTGQRLYYNIKGSSIVELTYPGMCSENNCEIYESRRDYYYRSGCDCHMIGYYYEKPSGDLIIPDSVWYNGTTYLITRIGNSAFRQCDALTTVIIGDKIEYIGDYAFSNCTSLNILHLGKNIKSIGTCAFNRTQINYLYYDCSQLSLSDADFEPMGLYITEYIDGIKSSGLSVAALKDPFYSIRIRTALTIEFGQHITEIPRWLLRRKAYTTSNHTIAFEPDSLMANTIILGFGISTIPDSLFMGLCVKTIILSDSVVSIGKHAFDGCSNLLMTQLPPNISTIGEYAFQSCVSMKGNLHLPTKIKRIERYTWNGCSQLDSIMIHDSITSIGDYAFNKCTNISYISIGTSVDTIGHSAFKGCNKIKKLFLPDLVKSIGTNAFMNCSNIDSIYFGTQLKSIGDGAFEDCLKIKKVLLPDSMKSIGTNAFMNCSNIDSIYFGTQLKSIGNGAFKNCLKLKKVLLSDSIVSIGANSFMNFSNIDSLYLGTQLKSIGDRAFYGDSIIICDLIIPNNVTTIGAYSFYGCSGINSLYIGSGVTTIGSYAFQGCSGVKHIHYNARNCQSRLFYGTGSYTLNGTTYYPAFYGTNTPNLTSLVVGDSVQSIPPCLVYSLSTIQGNLSIPASVQDIGSYAFYNCDNVLSVSTNARSIGRGAFEGCDRLVEVGLGDSVRTIGSRAFQNCFRLKNVSWGDGITAIGDSAFKGCTRLLRSELPQALVSIGNHAFDGCVDLGGKLTFPPQMTSIGDYAYTGNGTIGEIEMQGDTPPTIYAHTFEAVDSLVTVSVPCGAVLNYYTTNYWENFPNIVEAPPYRVSLGSNNEVMGTATVAQQPTCTDHTALVQATAHAGYHFLQWNDGNSGNPRQLQLTRDTALEALFAVNYSHIAAEANDPLMGHVAGTGTYNYNAPVTLTATPNGGYHFLRWSDGSTQNPRYLAATRDSAFTAIFASNVSTISVGNANPGMGNVGGSGVYYYQNLVSLTATPAYGHHFTQWNDGNTQNPRTITVSQDSTFTAFFALNTYSIVATAGNTTMGSVSGSGSYTYLHETSITATPAYGYHFVQWHDQVTDNPRTLTVTRDSAFTAQFAANSYALTSEPNDPTMGSAYGSGTYHYGTTATLTAVETYGYHFTQWSDGVTDNPRTLTVQNSATYTAQFEINSYLLTVQSANPAVGTASGGGSYYYLTPVNITALPGAGHHFTQWSDGNTDNPRTVSVTHNATYTAQFAINSYAVGATSGNSTMGLATGSGTYSHGSTATLAATAHYGYHFVQWSDGNMDNPRTVVVTDSAQFTAEFAHNSYLLTAASSNLTLGSATGGGSYPYLQQMALTAVPAPHYHFTLWNDNIEDNPRTVTLTRDTSFTAHFAIDRHTVVVGSADDNRGSASGSDTVDYGTALWIAASARYGYHFTQWNDGNTQNPRRVAVQHDTAFTASFAPNQYEALCLVNDTARGAVANAGGSYSYLTPLTFTANPAPGYHFLRWSNGSTGNPISFALTQDTVLTALLVGLQAVSLDSTKGSVQHTKQANLLEVVTATPTSSHHFLRWSDGLTDNPRTVALAGDTSLAALFVGLTAQADDSTKGSVQHTWLANLLEVVTATPRYGYHFAHWQDGHTDNPRTVALAGDTLLTAHFAINTYFLSASGNDDALGSVQGGGHYPYLTQATLAATAAEHCHFVQWSDGSTTNPRLVTLTSDTAFTALFAPDPIHRIVVDANDTSMGHASGGGLYYTGERAVLTASAAEHHRFAQWSDGHTGNPRTVTVAGEATFTALFEPEMHTVAVSANDYSMGQVAGGGSFAYGHIATIEARAFEDCRFVQWSDGPTEAVRTLVVTDDMELQALFERRQLDGIDPTGQPCPKVVVRQGHILIEGLESLPKAEAQLFDLAGRRHSLAEELPPGVYLLRVGRWTKKVVVPTEP